jgi:hypothetical protein
VQQISSSTIATLPENRQELRDRSSRLHLLRIVAGLGALALLAFAAIFENASRSIGRNGTR